MQIWTTSLPFDYKNQILQETFTEDSIFFDIETTGFSPASTQLYLIGTAKRTGDSVIIDQYFAESKEEEADILSAFLRHLKSYQTIITFNGIGFDIPYLKAKCDHYHLEEDFADKDYLDLFKIVSSLKFLLKLPNYKQKTLESFLGIEREDVFDGGQLINIYHEYVNHPTEYQMYFLKQHNYEDVLGMLDLLPVLSYSNLFKGGYRLLNIESNTYHDYDGVLQKELLFTLENDIPLPKRVSCRFDSFYLTACGSHTKLAVHLYDGELKYYFPNYKDYYYLPAEDRVIPKEIASSVSAEFRKKATANTCYTKKHSLFLPQYCNVITPVFHKERKDKLSYFELTDDFIDSNSLLHQYIDHVLAVIAKQKH